MRVCIYIYNIHNIIYIYYPYLTINGLMTIFFCGNITMFLTMERRFPNGDSIKNGDLRPLRFGTWPRESSI